MQIKRIMEELQKAGEEGGVRHHSHDTHQGTEGTKVAARIQWLLTAWFAVLLCTVPICASADTRKAPSFDNSAHTDCPVYLEVQATSSGLGHMVTTLSIAISLAKKLEAQVVLGYNFWGGSSTHTHGSDYKWAEDYFPFYAVDDALLTHMHVITHVTPLELSERNESKECNTYYKINAGTIGACHGWCILKFPGSFRSAADSFYSIYNEHKNKQQLSVSQPPKTPAGNDAIVRPDTEAGQTNGSLPAVQVVWHCRVGDVLLDLRPEDIAAMFHAINGGFQQRKVVHTVISSDTSDSKRFFTDAAVGNSSVAFREFGPKETFEHFIHADVLVSLASSFPYAASLLVPPGKQIHIYYPPKELHRKPTGAIVQGLHELTEEQISAHPAYRFYFHPRNIIPVTFNGHIFQGYAEKFAVMSRYIDEFKEIPGDISMQHSEVW